MLLLVTLAILRVSMASRTFWVRGIVYFAYIFFKYCCGSIWPLYAALGSIVAGEMLYHAKEKCPSKKSFIEYVAEVLDLSYFVFLFNMAIVLLPFYFLEVIQLVFACCFYAYLYNLYFW